MKEKYPWVRNLKVNISVMFHTSPATVKVTFYDAILIKSMWTIQGLNLLVNQTNLSQTHVLLYASSSQRKPGIVSISNSTFGRLKIVGKYEANVYNCSINGATRPEVTLMDITNTKLHLHTSTFIRNVGNIGAAVLKATQSNVSIQQANFSGNVGHNGVIEIGNGSSLTIKHSSFENNGHWFFALSTILVKSKSSARVENCTFISNSAANGAGVCSMANTSIIVDNSSFFNNSGQLGSSINCNDQLNNDHGFDLSYIQTRSMFKLMTPTLPRVPMDKSTLYKNHSFMWKSNVQVINDPSEYSKCSINRSVFRNNEAYVHGGAIYIQGRSAEVTESYFEYNIGGLTGGAISSYNKARVKITNSLIKNNQAILGSAVSSRESVMMFISNCSFPHPESAFFTGFSLHASNSSLVTIMNSTFTSVRTVPWILDIQNFTSVLVVDSDFTATSRGILYALNNVKVNFTRCSFHNRCGLEVYDNVFLILTYSRIIGCSSFYGNIIQLSYGSNLYLFGTTIGNNQPGPPGSFILSETGSTVTMINCLYVNNYMWYHIVVTKGSLNIINCEFIDNTKNFAPYAAMMFLTAGSKVSVTRSKFKNNLSPAWREFYQSVLFRLYDGRLNITDSTFVENHADILIEGKAFTETPSHYIQISNSTFDNYVGSIQMADVADIIIQDSFFQINTAFFAPGYLIIENANTVRIANSHFNSSTTSPQQIYFEQESILWQTMYLRTLRSNFTIGNQSVASGSEDFMKKMETSQMFHVDFTVTVDVLETKYASSEYYYK